MTSTEIWLQVEKADDHDLTRNGAKAAGCWRYSIAEWYQGAWIADLSESEWRYASATAAAQEGKRAAADQGLACDVGNVDDGYLCRPTTSAEETAAPAAPSEEEVEEALVNLFEGFYGPSHPEFFAEHAEGMSVLSFGEAGLLTRNRGIVLTIGGCQYQLQIVRAG